MNMTNTKVLISVFKNHKFFSKNITTYRDIPLQNLPLSDHFPPKKFGHATGSPQTWYAYTIYLYPCCVQISTFHVQRFFFLLKAK